MIVEHADDPETMQEALYPVLADFFKPALLARMEVVPYLPLSKETLATIIAGKLARLDNEVAQPLWRGRDYWAGSDGRNHEPRHPRGKRREDAGIGYRRRHAAAASLPLLQKMAANTAIARIRLSAADGAFTADVEDALPDDAVTPQTEDETVL